MKRILDFYLQTGEENTDTANFNATVKKIEEKVNENDVEETEFKNIHTPGKSVTSTVHSPRMSFSPASISLTPVSKSKKYSSRTNSGDIICTYGVKMKLHHANENTEISVTIPAKFVPVSNNARYMNDPLLPKLSTIKKYVDNISLDIVTNNNLQFPVDVHNITMDTTTFTGQIKCDSNGKLNTSSILLEGSLFNTHGENVELQVTDLSEYSLFPGQIIAVEGKNPTGLRIIAEKLYTDVKLSDCCDPDIKEPLRIFTCVGPFTLSDNLAFEPVQDLLNRIHKFSPHVVIIIGPIVDASHPNISDLSVDYSVCYENILTEILDNISENIKVVVVNSWREVYETGIYPTAPVPTNLCRQNLLLVPDPCIISISGFIVGLTSTDILMHLGKEELFCSIKGPSMDRLGRLASHLFQQKSFYPLLPASEEISVDFSMCTEHCKVAIKPHLMILPSDLRCFIKNIHGSVVMNPEKITKGHIGGNIAEIEVRPLEENEELWSIESHVSIQIVKI